MKKGNILRSHINRTKYHLSPTKSQQPSIAVGSLIKEHGDRVSVKFMDIFGNGAIKYATINKKDIIEVV